LYSGWLFYQPCTTKASRGSNKARTKNTLHWCLTYAIMNTLHGCPTYPYYVHCYWVLHIAIRGTFNTDATSVRNVLMGTLHGCPTYLNHEHPTRVPYIYLREYFTWVLYLLSREYPPRVSFLCHHGHPSCVPDISFMSSTLHGCRTFAFASIPPGCPTH
jgi:hypothetical protein